jgi:protein-tyrosine phosphatase
VGGDAPASGQLVRPPYPRHGKSRIPRKDHPQRDLDDAPRPRPGYPVGVIDTAARHLPLDGTRNVRDVGGYPAAHGSRVRWRTLLRSDELTRLPAAAQEELVELGIRQVIDLRWPEELERAPSVFVRSDRVRYTPISLLADDPTPHGGLAGMYRHVFDARAEQLAAVVRALLADGGLPVVIGCAAGKDRTGVTIALLLDLVGVDHATIVDDYALSAGYFARPAIGTIEADDWRHPELIVESTPVYMRVALDHLATQHGGARALLRAQGLTDAELDRLVSLLTETA